MFCVSRALSVCASKHLLSTDESKAEAKASNAGAYDNEKAEIITENKLKKLEMCIFIRWLL